jgi:hypothetical protein
MRTQHCHSEQHTKALATPDLFHDVDVFCSSLPLSDAMSRFDSLGLGASARSAPLSEPSPGSLRLSPAVVEQPLTVASEHPLNEDAQDKSVAVRAEHTSSPVLLGECLLEHSGPEIAVAVENPPPIAHDRDTAGDGDTRALTKPFIVPTCSSAFIVVAAPADQLQEDDWDHAAILEATRPCTSPAEAPVQSTGLVISRASMDVGSACAAADSVSSPPLDLRKRSDSSPPVRATPTRSPVLRSPPNSHRSPSDRPRSFSLTKARDLGDASSPSAASATKARTPSVFDFTASDDDGDDDDRSSSAEKRRRTVAVPKKAFPVSLSASPNSPKLSKEDTSTQRPESLPRMQLLTVFDFNSDDDDGPRESATILHKAAVAKVPAGGPPKRVSAQPSAFSPAAASTPLRVVSASTHQTDQDSGSSDTLRTHGRRHEPVKAEYYASGASRRVSHPGETSRARDSKASRSREMDYLEMMRAGNLALPPLLSVISSSAASASIVPVQADDDTRRRRTVRRRSTGATPGSRVMAASAFGAFMRSESMS